MVVDASALLAVLLREPERDAFIAALGAEGTRLVSAMSHLETSLVLLSRKGRPALRELDLLVHDLEAQIVSVDRDQVLLARDAFERYGKGRHPASLNLGDCCTYALCALTGEPLLFKGGDFARTDLQLVRPA